MRTGFMLAGSWCLALAALVACSSSSGSGGSSSDGGGAGSTDGSGSSSSGGGSSSSGGSGSGGGSSSSGSGSDGGSGGATPIALATGQSYPGGIAANGSYVVWTTSTSEPLSNLNGTGPLMAVAPSGGTPTAITASTDNAAYVAADATYAYWFGPDNNQINKVALAGGPIISIEKNLTDSIYEMTVDPNNVYWANIVNVIHAVPLDGGTNTALANLTDAGFNSAYQTQGMAVSSAGVFVACSGQIVKLPPGGGSFSTLASGQNPTVIIADATSVYWGGSGAIMKVGAAGGTPTILAELSIAEIPAYMALDADTLYWMEPTASIKKVPIAGGTPVVLAGAPAVSGGIAVDGTNVYWTDTNAGTVYKIAK